MALLTPPPAAPQRGDRTTFAIRVDAFITWLINFVSEMLALVANLNSLAAGGAYAIPYTFGTGGTLGSTAGGRIAVSDYANQASTPYFLADFKDARGKNVSLQLAQSGASTSGVKATVRLQKIADPSAYMVLNVTSYGATTWGALSGSVVDASSTNPFADGDAVMLLFQRTGDKGDTGAAGSSLTGVMHVYDSKANSVSGGAASAGVNIRTLNTVARNTIPGASLASNRVTLPAGTYRVMANAPAYGVGGSQAYLYNVTASGLLALGPSVYDSGGTVASDILGEFVLTAQSQIELRQACGSSSGNLGQPASSGLGEMYSQVFFEKVA